jgi:hypothetical protein
VAACARARLPHAVPDRWTKVNTGTYLGTVGFSYLCFIMFLLFFFALVIFQGEVRCVRVVGTPSG